MPSGIGMSTAFRSVSESDGAPEELAAASGLKVMSAFVRLFGGGCDGETVGPVVAFSTAFMKESRVGCVAMVPVNERTAPVSTAWYTQLTIVDRNERCTVGY